MPGDGAERDPVSVLFDIGAAAFLERAYAARGQWVGSRVADPAARHLVALRAMGIDPLGRDNPSAEGGRRGGLNARDRWRRGFVRAVYYANDSRHGGRGRAIEIQVGRKVPARGIIPPGRAVRIRTRRGGGVALRAVDRKPEAARIWVGDHERGGRFSDPALRDW